MLVQFLKKYLLNKKIFTSIFFLSLLPLFFYRLGEGSLFSFDEAWYADIARNLIESKNPFLLQWNGVPFLDHPPLGFWLMAISFRIFGVNEFSARFFSALFGWGAVMLTYLLGKKLFKTSVGLLAGLMLSTSVWFILRARTGNLDVILVFFFLLVFYCASQIKTNKLYLYGTMLSMALLWQVKAIVGITILPIVLFFIIKYKKYFKIKDLIFSIILLILVFSPYLIINFFSYGDSFWKRLLNIGLRGRDSSVLIHYQLPLFYLHMGIREWYYPFLIAFLGNIFFLKRNGIIVLYLYLLAFFLPFLTSSKTEIWHLLPLYPIVGIMIFSFLDNVRLWLIKIVNINNLRLKNTSIFLMLLGGMLFAGKQILEFKEEIYHSKKTSSSEAKISQIASLYTEPLYITEHYYPEAVFYSKKIIKIINPSMQFLDKQNLSLRNLFNSGENFILLTTESALSDNKIKKDEYQLITKEGNNILIKKSYLR